jgi:replicative DNA helicase
MNAISHFKDRISEQNPMPDAMEAEQALLGALMLNNEVMTILPANFVPEFFGDEVHRKIFRAMQQLRDQAKSFNPVTIRTFINDVEIVRGLTISQYLARLTSEAVSVINAEDYAWATVEASVRRRLVALSEDVMRAGLDREIALVDEIDAAMSYLQDLRTTLDGGNADGTSIAQAMQQASEITEKAMSNSYEAGVHCGLEPVHQLIGALLPGKLIVLGGAPKQGKSALSRQIALGAASNGAAVFDYSGEMDASELSMREIARKTGISASRQMDGDVSPQELAMIKAARVELGKLRWFIQDQRRTLEQLCKEFEAFVKRHGFSVLIVDSVTLFDRDKDTRRLEKYAFAEHATERLKALARKTKCPVIALSQLKRDTFAVERSYNKAVSAKTFKNVISRRPRATDLYGACERDADHVIIPFNPMPILLEIEPPESSDEHIIWEDVVEENKGKAQIILALSRSRQPSRRDVVWQGATTSFLPKNEYAQREFF